MKKKVLILGSTGSIGESALRVCASLPDRLEVVGLVAATSSTRLAEQAREFGVKRIAIKNSGQEKNLRQLCPQDCKIRVGEIGILELCRESGADIALCAIVGAAALRPALTCVDLKMDIALASKEVLVMAGKAFSELAKKKSVKILPVDSEHNAIFQCLDCANGGKKREIKRLILTASGGALRDFDKTEILNADSSQALNHPTWSMGKKITVDSATLMNKALEMLEARWLFDIEMSKISVIMHRQSIVHSMVEYIDGSIIAQLSKTDMRLPIQYALLWPQRHAGDLPRLELEEMRRLDFEKIREDAFISLKIAREADKFGKCAPAVMNAANEVAVDHFLKNKIKLGEIWQIIEKALTHYKQNPHDNDDLDAIIEADTQTRSYCQRLLEN